MRVSFLFVESDDAHRFAQPLHDGRIAVVEEGAL